MTQSTCTPPVTYRVNRRGNPRCKRGFFRSSFVASFAFCDCGFIRTDSGIDADYCYLFVFGQKGYFVDTLDKYCRVARLDGVFSVYIRGCKVLCVGNIARVFAIRVARRALFPIANVIYFSRLFIHYRASRIRRTHNDNH